MNNPSKIPKATVKTTTDDKITIKCKLNFLFPKAEIGNFLGIIFVKACRASKSIFTVELADFSGRTYKIALSK